MKDFTEIIYVIDSQDRLVSVSEEWIEFALSNHGDGLLPEQVKGRPIWDFIADEPTRELYEALLAHVRSGCVTELVLRCDGPDRRRLIEMIVTQRRDGNVEFKTVLLAAKPRASQPLLDKCTPRTARHLMVCSWCDKVNVAVDKWFEVEAAMEYLDLAGETELPMVEPVVCPECFEKVMDTLGRPRPRPAVESGV